eukprot:TRINITY_DN18371_c4_g1_i1.p1 TRINITY_DN18371_c4_g1~~TRINITY_DN18371_c4_g1_i1.p1  ORF type:complete len:207 (-),score=38.86 TRINITY_DN18371_c4_g1_i1:112-732(-)
MAYALVGACMLQIVQRAQAATLRGASPLDTIANAMEKLPLVAVADDSGLFDNATAFFDELKDKAAPESTLKRSLLDPQPVVGFFSCARDTTGCPQGFVASGEGVQVCVPESSYRGPCSSPVDFSSMPIFAEARWAEACRASWPCSACARDYSGCPVGWTSSDVVDADRCVPPAAYIGGCDAADFSAASVADIESWASSCGAAWPCK